MENKQVKLSPLCMAVYDKLKANHVGRSNAISMENLSAYFGISTRCLRHCLSELRTSPQVEKVILSGDTGYYIASAIEECRKGNRRLYSMAFSLLRCARSNEKKASLDGQAVIDDSILEDFTRFLKAFGQED